MNKKYAFPDRLSSSRSQFCYRNEERGHKWCEHKLLSGRHFICWQEIRSLLTAAPSHIRLATRKLLRGHHQPLSVTGAGWPRGLGLFFFFWGGVIPVPPLATLSIHENCFIKFINFWLNFFNQKKSLFLFNSLLSMHQSHGNNLVQL